MQLSKGTWFSILQLLNICGVVSNAFLIAFTSSWGKQFTTTDKLWIVIGFEVSYLMKPPRPPLPRYRQL